MEFLNWINDIITALLSFVPRPVIVRATHGGVKWPWGKKPKEMKPGFHWYWPFSTEIEVIPTARQTLNLKTQALMTKDRQQVAVGALAVYTINDVVRAIGKRNFDIDATVYDITQAAIVEAVTKWNLDDLLTNISGKVETQLTRTVQKRLRQFGVRVQRAALTDFSTAAVYKILSDGLPQMPPPDQEEAE